MHSIGSKHGKGGFSLQLFAVIGHALRLRDDPNHLAAVESRVLDLCLEWESNDLREVDILHAREVTDLLERVFESDLRLLGYVADVAHHQRHVVGEALRVLVSELQALVELHFSHDIRSNDG